METKLEATQKNPNITPLIYSSFDYGKREKLRAELEKLFNQLGIDNEMDMTDFVLAEMVDNFIMTVYNANNATNKLKNNGK